MNGCEETWSDDGFYDCFPDDLGSVDHLHDAFDCGDVFVLVAAFLAQPFAWLQK